MELRNTIKEVSREIVINFPDLPCKRINTFSILIDGDNFFSDNMEMNYKNYLAKEFWSRSWVNKGADENNLSKEYPVLTLEQKILTREDPFSLKECLEFWVIIADKIDCPSCPMECHRTINQIDRDLFDMARIYLNELSTYSQYQIDESYFLFVSEGQLNYWLSEGIITSHRKVCDIYTPIISDEEKFSIQATDLPTADNIRAISFPLTFCTCDRLIAPFNYGNITPEEKAYPKCKSC